MKILAVDQSFTCTAFCLFKDGKFQFTGTANTTVHQGTKIYRAAYIADKLLDLANLYEVDLTIIEGLGYGSFGNATRDLAGLSYIVQYVMAENGFPLIEIPPTTLKKFATGKGNAKKEAMFNSLPIDIKERFSKSYKKTKGRYDVTDAYWLGRYAIDNKLGVSRVDNN